jgi:thiamine-phosphate pyrophosphorylase
MDAAAVSQLYAVIEAGEAAPERLSAALGAAPIASVLIVPAAGATLDAGSAKPLVEMAQEANAAALIAGDAQLARSLRADGVHVQVAKDLAGAYAAARAILGERGIVGVDAAISRHDAMTLAEAGADYIAFGAPAHLKDRDKARGRRDELVVWWAEIFEVPCVAFDVETRAEAEALSRAGADFIAFRLPSAVAPAATREFVAGIAAALAVSETAD